MTISTITQSMQGSTIEPVRILLAEDAPTMRAIARLGLTQALKSKGIPYELHQAQDGREALEHIAQSEKRYDLLFTDDQMPHATGTQIIETISQNPKFPASVVYLVSSTLTPEIEQIVTAAHPKVFCRAKGNHIADITQEAITNTLSERYNTRLKSRHLTGDEMKRMYIAKQRIESLDEMNKTMEFYMAFVNWFNTKESIAPQLRETIMFHKAARSGLSHYCNLFDLGGEDSVERFVGHTYHALSKK